jgi:hypothetical protein
MTQVKEENVTPVTEGDPLQVVSAQKFVFALARVPTFSLY